MGLAWASLDTRSRKTRTLPGQVSVSSLTMNRAQRPANARTALLSADAATDPANPRARSAPASEGCLAPLSQAGHAQLQARQAIIQVLLEGGPRQVAIGGRHEPHFDGYFDVAYRVTQLRSRI